MQESCCHGNCLLTEDKAYTSSRARRRVGGDEGWHTNTNTCSLASAEFMCCQSHLTEHDVVRVRGTHYIYINSMHLRYVQFPSAEISDACEGVQKLIEHVQTMFLFQKWLVAFSWRCLSEMFTFTAKIKKLFYIKNMKPVSGPHFSALWHYFSN